MQLCILHWQFSPTRRISLCLLGVQGKKYAKTVVNLSQVTQCMHWISTFCSCFVVYPLQLHCIDMSFVINYSYVFLSLTVKKAVSTVSERLSLPPAGWKYEENCESIPPSHLDYFPMYIQVFFMFPSLLVMSVFSVLPCIYLLESETQKLCILFASQICI